ncbi:MAG: MFS transporter [Bacteroidia bacterium]
MSDRYGRVQVIKLSSLLVVASLLVMAFANTPLLIILASGFIGFSTGMTAPTVFAWTIDLSASESRGRAMFLTFIFLEIGIGVGALVSAWAYVQTIRKFHVVFVTAVVALLSWLYLWFFVSSKST